MNYQDYVQELGVLLPQPLLSPFTAAGPFVDSNYNTILPRCIEYAELMIYRDPDLNLLHDRETLATSVTTSGTRTFTLPTAIIIAEQVMALTPAGATSANGTRITYLPASVDYINLIWPNASATATPGTAGYPQPVFAMLDDTTCVLAPTPDATYTMEVTGIFRPATLAQSNAATTYLTTAYPDLFLAASMIYMTGVMKDYGAQSDDPQMATSWTAQYNQIKRNGATEEARKRQAGVGWTAYPPTPIATPPRS